MPGDNGFGSSGGAEPWDGPGTGGSDCPNPDEYWDATQGRCVPRPGGNVLPPPPPPPPNPVPVPQPGYTDPYAQQKIDCTASGGTWNTATNTCVTSPSQDCINSGGQWDAGSNTCDYSGSSDYQLTDADCKASDKKTMLDPSGRFCVPINDTGSCPDVYRPVTCPNGATYPNECEASKAGQSGCTLVDTGLTEGGSTTDDPTNVITCPSGQYWDASAGICKNYPAPPPITPGQVTNPNVTNQPPPTMNPDMPGYTNDGPTPNVYAPGPAPTWDDFAPPDLYTPASTGPSAPVAPGIYTPGGSPTAPSGNSGVPTVGGTTVSPFGPGSFTPYNVGTSVLPPPPPSSAFDVGQSATANYAQDVYNTGQSQGFTQTGIGGISAYDVNAQGMNYGEIQDFTDQAYSEAMRNLEPQQEAERQRFEQELINKGIDPYSDAGQKEMAALERSQNDQKSKAAYDAMAFGAQMQEQMFGQGATESQMAQSLLNSQWNMQQQGREFDVTAGMSAEQQAYNQQMQDYQANQAAREFDVTAGMSAEAQQFDQMMQNYNAAQAGHEFDVTTGMQAENDAFAQQLADWQQRQANLEFGQGMELTADQQAFDQVMAEWSAAQQGYEYNTNMGLSANELAYNQQLASAQLDSQNAQYYAGLGLDAANAQAQQQLDRYSMEQAGYQFMEEMTMAENLAQFDQMMQLEGLDYRDYLTSVDQARYQDSLALGLAGLAPAPGYSTINTGMPQAGAAQQVSNGQAYNELFG